VYGSQGAGKDELYQSMHEGGLDGDHESYGQTSIRDLPKSVV